MIFVKKKVATNLKEHILTEDQILNLDEHVRKIHYFGFYWSEHKQEESCHDYWTNPIRIVKISSYSENLSKFYFDICKIYK